VLLVDEFQDTDPLQAELLLLLASEAGDPSRVRRGALFIVGDPKQSIYRFRRADVGVYRRIAEAVTRDGAREVTLQTSYRGVPEIQRFVNAAFRDGMNGDAEALQAAYVDLRPSRADHPAQPAIVALPIPRPYGRRQVTLDKLQESQPQAIAEFVRWLVSRECPWSVEAADPRDPRARIRRAIVPSDICLLFRRFLHFGDDVTRPYVSELEARGVPHLLVGGKTFHEREEVDSIRTALVALEWPEDELSVFATLRGPLFAIGDEELLEYYSVARAFHPYRVPEGLVDRLQPIVAALTTLRQLHAARNHRPVAHTIGELIEITRAHAGFILWKSGEQVLANVLHVSELARQYELEGGMSFRGFVEALREAAQGGQAAEAPILEESSDGVRIMTVHKAKGLEFPVVILADLTCKMSRGDASRYLDADRQLLATKIGGWAPYELHEHEAEEVARDEAEGVRVAYVAATRARDLLVVTAVGDASYDGGWVSPLSPAIYGGDATTAAGVPDFRGRDTILDRPDHNAPTLHTMRPGAFAFTDPTTGSGYTAVWWDPLHVDRAGAERRGLRHEHLIGKDAPAEVVAADLAAYRQWRSHLDATIAKGQQPGVQVMTATEWAHATADGTVALPGAIADLARGVRVVDAGVFDPYRPTGARFGILVHALLAHVPLDATVEQVARLAAVQARMLRSSDEERAAAAAMVDRALKHPLLDRARAARAARRSCRREVSLGVVVEGVVVDGQADLLFDDGDHWQVVDFKTDVEITGSEAIYQRQVALYVDAARRATGATVEGTLLRV
jgi:ATP-dependent exoDNAse (exonuclease V) beta subunit